MKQRVRLVVLPDGIIIALLQAFYVLFSRAGAETWTTAAAAGPPQAPPTPYPIPSAPYVKQTQLFRSLGFSSEGLAGSIPFESANRAPRLACEVFLDATTASNDASSAALKSASSLIRRLRHEQLRRRAKGVRLTTVAVTFEDLRIRIDGRIRRNIVQGVIFNTFRRAPISDIVSASSSSLARA